MHLPNTAAILLVVLLVIILQKKWAGGMEPEEMASMKRASTERGDARKEAYLSQIELRRLHWFNDSRNLAIKFLFYFSSALNSQFSLLFTVVPNRRFVLRACLVLRTMFSPEFIEQLLIRCFFGIKFYANGFCVVTHLAVGGVRKLSTRVADTGFDHSWYLLERGIGTLYKQLFQRNEDNVYIPKIIQGQM